MEAKGVTPILNVSDIASTFAWFEKWGWKKLWDWGTPPTFGAVGSGKEVCIFLCQGAQGGRGRGANTTTFQQDGDEAGDEDVWMSVWGDDVDEMHKHCVAAGLEVTFPPTDLPWQPFAYRLKGTSLTQWKPRLTRRNLLRSNSVSSIRTF